MTIVPSLSDSKEFYVFRKSGEEVKCRVNNNKIVRSANYHLKPMERFAILQYVKCSKVMAKSEKELVYL